MNSDERLLQILENSACLSKGQLLGYIKHTLYPEELRAVELHLSSCALCNDALEGLEHQQDAEALLSGLTPPVLPSLPAREKPKEKKENHTAHEEKAAAAPARSHHATEHGGGTYAFRPRRRWARPLGIAAALLLGFGALWYFEFNKKEHPKELAQQEPQATQTEQPAITDSPKAAMAAAPAAKKADTMLIAAAEQKRKDSILLARKEAAKLLTQKDTAQSALLARKNGKPASEGEVQAMVAKNEVTSAKESTAVADDGAARKAMAAVPAATSRKEENKDLKKDNKKELSDYELGLQKYKEKNYASALMYFKSAESDKSDPRHWEAVYYSALCNKNLDKKRKAIKLFERVIDANAPQKKAAQKQLDELKKAN